MQRRRFVFLNQSLVPIEQAHVSVEDPGFLLGDGVFETCGAFNGVPFLLDEHLKRLREGLQFVGIKAPAALDVLPQTISEVLQANDLRSTKARVRITVSRGADDEPNFLVTAIAWKAPEGLTSGVQLDFATMPVVASAWRQVKSTSRQTSVLAGRARAAGVYDSLQTNTHGLLTEGTYSNLFCVGPNGLVTPPVADGCLAGVTRAAVLEVAQRLGVEVSEESIRPQELADMQETFLTSSMSGVVPVQSVQMPAVIPAEWQATMDANSTLQFVSPGPITLKMLAAYKAWQEEVTCQQR